MRYSEQNSENDPWGFNEEELQKVFTQVSVLSLRDVYKLLDEAGENPEELMIGGPYFGDEQNDLLCHVPFDPDDRSFFKKLFSNKEVIQFPDYFK